MKTLIPALVLVLSLSCQKENTKPLNPSPAKDYNPAATSIDAMKDGRPFINYMGYTLPGC